MKKFPNAKIVISGSGPTYGNFTITSVTKMFYSKVGVDVDRIIFEDKSRNTYENFIFSKKFIENGNNNKWLLVTSAIHMKRAMNVAEKLKLNFIPYPVDFTKTTNFTWKTFYRRNNYLLNMNDFQSAVYEYIGLLAYYITGKSSKIY